MLLHLNNFTQFIALKKSSANLDRESYCLYQVMALDLKSNQQYFDLYFNFIQMARKKVTENYIDLLRERKVYTENVVKCTSGTYEDFSAVFAANCWLKNIPEDATCSFVKDELKQSNLNSQIATIIHRTYAKRENEKSGLPLAKRRARTSKTSGINKTLESKKKKSVTDIKDELAKGLGDPQFAIQEMIKVFMERLPNFNYNNTFIAKLLVLYSTLKPTGRLSEIFTVGKSQGVSPSETSELIENFKRLGVLTIEDSAFKKSVPADLFISPTE